MMGDDERIRELERMVSQMRTYQNERVDPEPQMGSIGIVNIVLAEDIDEGDSGNATMFDYDHDATDWATTSRTITVFNWQAGDLKTGAKCYAMTRPWGFEILPVMGMHAKALFITFKLDAALATSDAEKAATVLEYSVGPDPGSTVTVVNLETHTSGVYVFEGDINDTGVARLDSNTGKYRITNMECP